MSAAAAPPSRMTPRDGGRRELHLGPDVDMLAPPHQEDHLQWSKKRSDPDDENEKALHLSHLPLIEKYRPKSLDEVISHRDVIRSVSRMMQTKRFPHLLFYGPPGTGKTSTALVLAQSLYGKNGMYMVKMLNASDDRGIDVVRGAVKTFCEQRGVVFDRPLAASGGGPDRADGIGNADATASGSSFSSRAPQEPTKEELLRLPKMVILDEADMLTKAAQLALRRMMEDFSENARFVIICNYLNKIIPAIQSRCASFRLNMLSDEEVSKCIRRVCHAEKLKITNDGCAAIAELGRGDLRRVLGDESDFFWRKGPVLLNLLQCASRLCEAGGEITEDNVYAFAAEPIKSHVRDLLHALLTLPYVEAYERVSQIMKQHHYGMRSVVEVVYKEVLLMELPFHVRVRVVPLLADIEARIALGAPDALQLAALVGGFMLARGQAEAIYEHGKIVDEEELRYLDMSTQERAVQREKDLRNQYPEPEPDVEVGLSSVAEHEEKPDVRMDAASPRSNNDSYIRSSIRLSLAKKYGVTGGSPAPGMGMGGDSAAKLRDLLQNSGKKERVLGRNEEVDLDPVTGLPPAGVEQYEVDQASVAQNRGEEADSLFDAWEDDVDRASDVEMLARAPAGGSSSSPQRVDPGGDRESAADDNAPAFSDNEADTLNCM